MLSDAHRMTNKPATMDLSREVFKLSAKRCSKSINMGQALILYCSF